MLFDENNFIESIDAVEHIKWEKGVFKVAPRGYSSLAFRISGSATIRSGEKKFFVNTSDILYVPQNMPYSAKYTDTEIIVVHFFTEKDDNEFEVFHFEEGEQLYKMFLKLVSVWKNKTPGFKMFSKGLLYNILGTFLEQESKENLPEHFLSAISFINSNQKDSSLNIDAVCKSSGISPTTFRQLFKKHYNKKAVEYITELRLENARNLISNGMSVENASYESGFNDPKYFSRIVKKYFGCTPRELKVYGK